MQRALSASQFHYLLILYIHGSQTLEQHVNLIRPCTVIQKAECYRDH